MNWNRPPSSPRWRRPESTQSLLLGTCRVVHGRHDRDRSRGFGLAAAAEVPEGRRADSEDALAAVVRLIDAEHAADSRERDVTARVFAGGFDVATSLSVLELARAIERATDRLAGFGHLLRRHIMTESVSLERTEPMHIVRIGDGSTERHSADSDRRQSRQSRADGGPRSARAAGFRAAGQAVRRHHRQTTRMRSATCATD